jgi:hypothetical protein
MTTLLDAPAVRAAPALFRGDAFVMYPRTNEGQGTDHGLPEMQQEQERGGREM